MPRKTGDRYEGEKQRLLSLMVEKRKAANFTQVQLAKRTRLPQPILSKLENGQRDLTVMEYVRYMLAIGADPVEPLKDAVRRLSS